MALSSNGFEKYPDGGKTARGGLEWPNEMVDNENGVVEKNAEELWGGAGQDRTEVWMRPLLLGSTISSREVR